MAPLQVYLTGNGGNVSQVGVFPFKIIMISYIYICRIYSRLLEKPLLVAILPSLT